MTAVSYSMSGAMDVLAKWSVRQIRAWQGQDHALMSGIDSPTAHHLSNISLDLAQAIAITRKAAAFFRW